MQRWLSPIPLRRKFSLELLTSQFPGCLGSFPKFTIPMVLPQPAGDQKRSIMAQLNIAAPAESVVDTVSCCWTHFQPVTRLVGICPPFCRRQRLLFMQRESGAHSESARFPKLSMTERGCVTVTC